MKSMELRRRQARLVAAAIHDRSERHGVCVQAGGHEGAWPVALAKVFRQVWTMEPLASSYARLRDEIQGTSVRAFCAALGDTARYAAVETPGEKTGQTWVRYGEGSVPVMRVDDLPIETLDALVLDVEGAELLALRGAEQMILQHRPLLVVERNPPLTGRFGYTWADVDAWIYARGYAPGRRLAGLDEYYTPL
jgi:FkbM family methyltransferase